MGFPFVFGNGGARGGQILLARHLVLGDRIEHGLFLRGDARERIAVPVGLDGHSAEVMAGSHRQGEHNGAQQGRQEAIHAAPRTHSSRSAARRFVSPGNDISTPATRALSQRGSWSHAACSSGTPLSERYTAPVEYARR